MLISVLSGKGGTGKTFISVNLSSVMKNGIYVDCDVEEPNGKLFIKPEHEHQIPVKVIIPKFDYSLCNGCMKCVDFCAFNALAYVEKPILFENICHSCGGCKEVCPQNAITNTYKTVGYVEVGSNDDRIFLGGKLNVGEESGIPIIKKMFKMIGDYPDRDAIIDAPPGTGCPVVETVERSDFCVLVAEPTIFGLENLKMVYELVKILKKPYAVVLNKSLKIGTNPSRIFCEENNIPIIGEIFFDKVIGEKNSNGKIVTEDMPQVQKTFQDILSKVYEGVNK